MLGFIIGYSKPENKSYWLPTTLTCWNGTLHPLKPNVGMRDIIVILEEWDDLDKSIT
jgi:hypothetical protein